MQTIDFQPPTKGWIIQFHISNIHCMVHCDSEELMIPTQNKVTISLRLESHHVAFRRHGGEVLFFQKVIYDSDRS